MTAPVSLQGLRGQLQEMQENLRNGLPGPVQDLLSRHDQDLREFLQSPAACEVGASALSALLDSQAGVQESLCALRDRASAALDSQRQAGRASRSYLASTEG